MVLVYGLPRDESKSKGSCRKETGESQVGSPEIHPNEDTNCSLRGRIWKTFLGVPSTVVKEQYEAIVKCGPSLSDSDIRNDTFRYVLYE
jgi:hypothetical protein